MIFAPQNQAFNRRSSVVLLLASIALAACENSTEPSLPAVIRVSAVTPTDISGVVATEVTSIPVVRVTDRDGNPLADFPVSFRTTDGGLPGTETALTDKTGVATVGSWKLGPQAGNQTLKAFYNEAQFGPGSRTDTAVFTAVARPGPLASVQAVEGVDQFALTGAPMPLRLRVADSFGNPVPGVHVAFSVVTGGGSIDAPNVLTGPDGWAASVIWTLGQEPGPQAVRAEADTFHVMFKLTACAPAECRLMFYRNSAIFEWDAGSVRKLTPDNIWSDFARQSPDGNHVAFIKEEGVGAGVFIMNADGSNIVRLTSGTYHSLTWSPDGEALALTNEAGGFIEVRSLNQNSGPPLQVALGYYPDWSPDGKQILFETPDNAIRAMNSMGGDIREILASDKRSSSGAGEPRWSPDGKRIAFTRYDRLGSDIYVMLADGSEMKRITSNLKSFAPSWSPDGKRIAFTESQGNDWSIFYVDETGGEPSLMIKSAAYAEWHR